MDEASKWSESVADELTVEEAAKQSLEAKLSTVAEYLPLAATQAKRDPEFVHQLRVSSRRSIAALTLFKEVVPNKHGRWLRRKLKQLRRAAGDARDLDVLAEKLSRRDGKGDRKLRKRIKRERAQAQEPLIKLHRKLLLSGSYQRHVKKLLSHDATVRLNETTVDFSDWARMHLEAFVSRLFEAAPRRFKDLDSLHRFRIRAKQLRYAMELLAPAFRPDLHDELYPIVEELQERLGKVNDHRAACLRLEGWIASSKKSDRKQLQQRLKQERQRLKKSIRELKRWWTPTFAEECHTKCYDLLKAPAHEIVDMQMS